MYVFQAAGVLAQIEGGNKKKQGIQVSFLMCFCFPFVALFYFFLEEMEMWVEVNGRDVLVAVDKRGGGKVQSESCGGI